MRAFVYSIPDFLAKPFVEKYAEEYEIPIPEDTNAGLDCHWVGGFYDYTLCAVIGLVTVPGGVYVHGFYTDGTKGGLRALSALTVITYGLQTDLYGYVNKKNKRMIRWLLRQGWTKEADSGNEFRFHHLP